MNHSRNSFWQPIDLIVDLFTKEGRRDLRGLYALLDNRFRNCFPALCRLATLTGR